MKELSVSMEAGLLSGPQRTGLSGAGSTQSAVSVHSVGLHRHTTQARLLQQRGGGHLEDDIDTMHFLRNEKQQSDYSIMQICNNLSVDKESPK